MARGNLADIEANPPVRAQRDVMLIDDVSEPAEWTATDSAANVVSSSLHVLGTQGLSFDKVAGTVDAGVTRSFAQLDASRRFSPSDFVELMLFTPGGTGAADVILRLGTNISNYAEWVFAGALMNDGEWNRLIAEIGMQDALLQVGAGLNLANITFVQVIARMNAAGKTFVGAVLDSVLLRGDGNV